MSSCAVFVVYVLLFKSQSLKPASKSPAFSSAMVELVALKIVQNSTGVVRQFISCVSFWQETHREEDRVTAMSVSWRSSAALFPSFLPQTSAR